MALLKALNVIGRYFDILIFHPTLRPPFLMEAHPFSGAFRVTRC